MIEEGMTFGRWTVIGDGPHYKGSNPYIECRCECGREYDVRTRSLRDGTSTQCKLCKYKEHALKMKKPDTGFNVWYYRYQGNAKTRNLPFQLTRDQFVGLCIQDCFYCGEAPPDRQVSPTHDIVAHGIDRINPDYGYNLDNCVPCCTRCNLMKRDIMEKTFMMHVEKIYKHGLKKKR